MSTRLGAFSEEDASGLVAIDDLFVHFPVRGSNQRVRAVDGITLTIAHGEVVGLIGESGSGKTTVGRTVVGLQRPTSGSVRLLGESIHELRGARYRHSRRLIQIIFQDPGSSLDPRMSIHRAVREPLDAQGMGDSTAQDRQVLGLLERVGLDASHASRYPHELSGGQKQRVSIARALTLSPKLLVCDEPLSALDVSVQASILNLFAEIQNDFGLSYLFISHDIGVVTYIADRIAVMYLGQIVELGTPSDLQRQPLHPYTEALFHAQPVAVPSRLRKRRVIVLEGDIPSPIDPPSGCRFHTRCPYAEQICVESEPALKEMSDGRVARCHFAASLELSGSRLLHIRRSGQEEGS